MKRLISGVFCAVFVCAGAFAAEAVYYFDPGTGTEKSANCSAVTEETVALGEGWYVVDGTDVTISEPLELTGAALVIPGRAEE